MPYKSKAQVAYMHINLPSIAKRWDKEYPNQGPLPQHVSAPVQKQAGYRKNKTQRSDY